MKKIFAMLLVVIMSFSIVSCSVLPEGLKDRIDSVKDSIFNKGDNNEDNKEDNPQEHTHKFEIAESKAAKCTVSGYVKYECSCGETKEDKLDALGHDMKFLNESPATCGSYGTINYKCTRCTKKESESIKFLGHIWGEEVEASRFIECNREGCDAVKLPDGNGFYDETLTFNFTEEHEAEITAKYEEVLAAVEAAPEYDPALHGYAEEGALKEEFDAVDALHTELYDLILYAVTQRQIAEIDYYCDMNDSALEERYSYMMDYYTDVISTFYSLSQPIYDSCYREFFYYGMTEPEIKAYLFEANALLDEEYANLTNRNNEIELAVLAITNPLETDEILELYAEFVQNNKRIAEILGYETYLDYAYENIYSREYSYKETAELIDFAKKYVAPVFCSLYSKYLDLANKQSTFTGDDWYDYYSQTSKSFFNNRKGNLTLNDYIDKMAFTSNPDKQYSFSDELNNLMSKGNLFRGQYAGAFVTSLSAFDLPIAYFGTSYDNPFTIAHEFGHYMNEIYNGDVSGQSYDLLEMHSQGNELLYLSFVKDYLTDTAKKLVEYETLINMLFAVLSGLAVDAFEQAVYLDSYDGTNSDIIMADGKITSDEYDLLYESIVEDLGTSQYQSTDYWRYGMTITSPCYYISYSVSAASVLQIYDMIGTKSFEDASEAYYKLFTYTDVDPDMSIKEIFEYAGLYYFTDEAMYMTILNMANKVD